MINREIIEPDEDLVTRAVETFIELPDTMEILPPYVYEPTSEEKLPDDGALLALQERFGYSITLDPTFMRRMRGVIKGMKKELGRQRRLT